MPPVSAPGAGRRTPRILALRDRCLKLGAELPWAERGAILTLLGSAERAFYLIERIDRRAAIGVARRCAAAPQPAAGRAALGGCAGRRARRRPDCTALAGQGRIVKALPSSAVAVLTALVPTPSRAGSARRHRGRTRRRLDLRLSGDIAMGARLSAWLARRRRFPDRRAAASTIRRAAPPLDYEPVGSLAGTMRVKDARRRFRRLRRAAAVRRSSQKLGLGQFPIVIGGVVAVVNIDGVAPGADEAHRTASRRHFPRQGPGLVRPGDQALNPDLKLPERQDRHRPSLRRIGHDLNFTHYLSTVKAHNGASRSASDTCCRGRLGTGAKRQRGCRARRAAHQEFDRLCRIRAGNAGSNSATALIQNRAGKFITPEAADLPDRGGKRRMGARRPIST